MQKKNACQKRSVSFNREQVKVSNMFALLQDMDLHPDVSNDEDDEIESLFLIGKKNIFRTKRKATVLNQVEKTKKKKKIKKTDSLALFEVKNRFELLEDNPEFYIENLIMRNNILRMSKKKLKKCTFCNFKKRSCLLNPTECKALECYCFKCFKKGHFPASIKCKGNKKITSLYQLEKVNILSY